MNTLKLILQKSLKNYMSFMKSKISIYVIGITIGTTSGIAIGKYIIHQDQSYKIQQFEIDFMEGHKTGLEVYNEGLRVIGTANNPKECFITVEAVWNTMRKFLKEDKSITNADIILTANDRLHENCR